MSADSENWTSADTKSEPPGSDGGAVAGRVSGGSWLFLATFIGGGKTIDSGYGLWARQGGQWPYSRGDGRAGGRDGNPRGGGGDAPAAGAGLEPTADRDGTGHLSSSCSSSTAHARAGCFHSRAPCSPAPAAGEVAAVVKRGQSRPSFNRAALAPRCEAVMNAAPDATGPHRGRGLNGVRPVHPQAGQQVHGLGVAAGVTAQPLRQSSDRHAHHATG